MKTNKNSITAYQFKDSQPRLVKTRLQIRQELRVKFEGIEDSVTANMEAFKREMEELTGRPYNLEY